MTSEEIKNYCEEALTISKQQGTQGGLTFLIGEKLSLVYYLLKTERNTTEYQKSSVFGLTSYYSYIYQEVNTILTALDLQNNILSKSNYLSFYILLKGRSQGSKTEQL